MRLNDANIVFSDEPLDNMRVPVRPLADCSRDLPVGVRRVVLVTKSPTDHDRYRDALECKLGDSALDWLTVKESSKRRVVNLIRNIKRAAKVPYMDAPPPGRWRGAVICGAGKPLLSELCSIRSLQRQGALVIATNRAVVSLVKHGVRPHLAFMAESKAANGQLVRTVPTVFDLTANPRNVAQVDKPAFMCSADPAFDELPRMDERLRFPTGPSVTTAAISWALAMGFRSILLAGCPMSSGSQDDPGYVPEAAGGVNRGFVVPCVSYDGLRRWTTVQMADEINWCGTIFSRSGVIIYDAHRGGAAKADFKPIDINEFPLVDFIESSQWPKPISRASLSLYRFRQTMGIAKTRAALLKNDETAVMRLANELPLLETYINDTLLSLSSIDGVLERQRVLWEAITRATRELGALWR